MRLRELLDWAFRNEHRYCSEVECNQHCWLSLSAGVSERKTTRIAPAEINRLAAKVEPQFVASRRDIHQNPELGNREMRTSGLVAEHLRRLGLEVTAQVAHTRVVGILRGGRAAVTAPCLDLLKILLSFKVT